MRIRNATGTMRMRTRAEGAGPPEHQETGEPGVDFQAGRDRWTTLRASLLDAGRRSLARSQAARRWKLPRRQARPVCSRERGSGTRNTGKEWCFVAKGMGMTPRLQYNFNSMA